MLGLLAGGMLLVLTRARSVPSRTSATDQSRIAASKVQAPSPPPDSPARVESKGEDQPKEKTTHGSGKAAAEASAHGVHHDPIPKDIRKSLPAQGVGEGYVSVYVRPWAIVSIDGKTIKQSPLVDYALPVGRHMIELVNPDHLPRRKEVPITITSDKHLEIREQFE
jgi:serine/threonine-protein kinase